MKAPLANEPDTTLHQFFAGDIAGNSFYSFAEKLHYCALVSLTGDADTTKAARKIYDEALKKVIPHFEAFSNEVLLAISSNLSLKIQAVETSKYVDPGTVPSVIFLDEKAILERVKSP